MSFTGDAETVRFKEILARVLEKNELNGKSPYALAFATKNSNGGWSFGVPQYDLSTGSGVDLFRNILENAQVKDESGNYIYIIDDGDPTTDREHDKKLLDLLSKAKSKNSTSLSSTERGFIDQALSSEYGITAIDNSLDSWFNQKLIPTADRVIALTSGADKDFLQSDLEKLFLCDFQNQYGISEGGPLEQFVQGYSVSLGGGTIVKQGTLGVDDLLAFYFRTKQARQTPWDPMRRFSNIVEATGYTPASLEEAKGVVRAYTYLYVPNESKLLQTPDRTASCNNFRQKILEPAGTMILAQWQSSWGPKPTSYDDILMGDDNANYNNSGDFQLNGRDGNDIIFGEGGNDQIEGGKGNDILIGGEGHDTYYYKVGDGNDRIVDTGENTIIIEGADGKRRTITNVYKTGADVWTTADGKAQFTHNSPWQIVLEDGSTIELGESFQDGDFGIHLLDMPSNPQTTTTIVGDLTPTNINNPQYDSLGNIITDPSSPSPNRADVLFDSAGNDRMEGRGGDDTIVASRGGDDWIKEKITRRAA